MNPGLLGTAQEFKKRFETPILRGRDADGTDEDHKIGNERLQEMATLVIVLVSLDYSLIFMSMDRSLFIGESRECVLLITDQKMPA